MDQTYIQNSHLFAAFLSQLLRLSVNAGTFQSKVLPFKVHEVYIIKLRNRLHSSAAGKDRGKDRRKPIRALKMRLDDGRTGSLYLRATGIGSGLDMEMEHCGWRKWIQIRHRLLRRRWRILHRLLSATVCPVDIQQVAK